LLPDGTPFTIAFTFARPIPVADLKAAFGAYQADVWSEPGMPWSLSFPDVVRGGFGSVALLDQVAGTFAKLDQSEVATVTLRIDPRL
jgi:hypothetical protein